MEDKIETGYLVSVYNKNYCNTAGNLCVIKEDYDLIKFKEFRFRISDFLGESLSIIEDMSVRIFNSVTNLNQWLEYDLIKDKSIESDKLDYYLVSTRKNTELINYDSRPRFCIYSSEKTLNYIKNSFQANIGSNVEFYKILVFESLEKAERYFCDIYSNNNAYEKAEEKFKKLLR